MGVIRKQGIQSSVLIYLGFALGALNVLVLFPKYFTPEEYGLTFVLGAIGKIILQFALLGTVPIMNKFFPYYNDNLTGKKNDFLTASFLLPAIGIVFTVIGLFFFKDLVIRKFYEKSPLLSDYYYLLYPFTIFLIIYTVLDTYSGTLLKTVVPTIIREIIQRIFTTLLIVLFAFSLFSYNVFIFTYSYFYLLAILLIVVYLRKRKRLNFAVQFSNVTKKFKSRMLTYGSFVYGGVLLGAVAENVDVIFIGGMVGLSSVAVYQIAHYMSTIVMIPYRSFSAIATPVIAQAWKDKNIALVNAVYHKTSLNQLIAGIGLFGAIWVNIDNISAFMGAEYAEVKIIVLLLGITRLIDLGFGLNSEILNTSNYWRFNFLSYTALTIIFLGTNYLFVSRYGIVGSAVSNLVSYFSFNLLRFAFIWKKMGIQPFTWNTLKIIALGCFSILTMSSFGQVGSIYTDALIRLSGFSLIFGFLLLKTNISEDISQIFKELKSKYLR